MNAHRLPFCLSVFRNEICLFSNLALLSFIYLLLLIHVHTQRHTIASRHISHTVNMKYNYHYGNLDCSRMALAFQVWLWSIVQYGTQKCLFMPLYHINHKTHTVFSIFSFIFLSGLKDFWHGINLLVFCHRSFISHWLRLQCHKIDICVGWHCQMYWGIDSDDIIPIWHSICYAMKTD